MLNAFFYHTGGDLVEIEESDLAKSKIYSYPPDSLNYFLPFNFFLLFGFFSIMTALIFYLLSENPQINNFLKNNSQKLSVSNTTSSQSNNVDLEQIKSAEIVTQIFSKEKKLSTIKVSWFWVWRRVRHGIDRGIQMGIQTAVATIFLKCAEIGVAYLYSKITIISSSSDFVYSKFFNSIKIKYRQIPMAQLLV